MDLLLINVIFYYSIWLNIAKTLWFLFFCRGLYLVLCFIGFMHLHLCFNLHYPAVGSSICNIVDPSWLYTVVDASFDCMSADMMRLSSNSYLIRFKDEELLHALQAGTYASDCITWSPDEWFKQSVRLVFHSKFWLELEKSRGYAISLLPCLLRFSCRSFGLDCGWFIRCKFMLPFLTNETKV